ncbi:hypothetical protein [Streptantibioticus parmotrematis]|uniref:hypothetical protein n=1 Tax=Streptantibioticus parmotrematis TaxID=2873249 RepID=UPI0027DFBF5C|nr:hypothetical protein [Streptantibioticus parmotrematis]
MGERKPNRSLAALLGEAGMSQSQVAGAVNRLAQEAGSHLRCDKYTVNKWIGGTTPREAIRPLVVEALARRLRRPVTLAEAGFPFAVA